MAQALLVLSTALALRVVIANSVSVNLLQLTTEVSSEAELAPGQCPNWCSAHEDSWQAKCTYHSKACNRCIECERTLKRCPRNCIMNEAPWQGKCQDNFCNGCDECADAKLMREGKKCPRWCIKHADSWNTKCAYPSGKCSGCDSCSADNLAELACPTSCRTNKDSWNVKCAYPTGECSGCDSCPSCPYWCSAHTDSWPTKCAYESSECGNCGECSKGKSKKGNAKHTLQPDGRKVAHKTVAKGKDALDRAASVVPHKRRLNKFKGKQQAKQTKQRTTKAPQRTQPNRKKTVSAHKANDAPEIQPSESGFHEASDEAYDASDEVQPVAAKRSDNKLKHLSQRAKGWMTKAVKKVGSHGNVKNAKSKDKKQPQGAELFAKPAHGSTEKKARQGHEKDHEQSKNHGEEVMAKKGAPHAKGGKADAAKHPKKEEDAPAKQLPHAEKHEAKANRNEDKAPEKQTAKTHEAEAEDKQAEAEDSLAEEDSEAEADKEEAAPDKQSGFHLPHFGSWLR